MKAKSAIYIKLQNIYKSKAREDIQTVLGTVRAIEKALNRTTPSEESEVEAFCKNAAHIKLVRGRPFPVIYADTVKPIWGKNAKSIRNSLSDETGLVPLYIAFMAYDEFCQDKAKMHTYDAAIVTGIARKHLIWLHQTAEADFAMDDEEDETLVNVENVCTEL